MFLLLNLETKIKKNKNVIHKKIEVGIFDIKHSNPPAIIEKNAIKLAIKLLLFQILKTIFITKITFVLKPYNKYYY